MLYREWFSQLRSPTPNRLSFSSIIVKQPIPRRDALKLIATATVVGPYSGSNAAVAATPPVSATAAGTPDVWSRTHDRVWLGGEYWANPMEDWEIADAVRNAAVLWPIAAPIQ